MTDPSDDVLAVVYATYRPLRSHWRPLADMLADPLGRRVLTMLALHCPKPSADAIRRGALSADPARCVYPTNRPPPIKRRPVTPFLDQKRKAAGDKDD